MTGKQFNDLRVIERADNYRAKDGTSYVMWKCVCKCGNTSVVRATSLKNNSVRSCGCSRRESAMGIGLIDITGMEFGYWKVLEKSRTLVEPRGKKVTLWKCQCKCGEIRELRAGTLKTGNSLSCGCYKYAILKANGTKGFTKSKAEMYVDTWLKENDFYYEPQKVYPDLRGLKGYPLSYDFLIYIENKPALLVECQGIQHYEPVEYFGGEESFHRQQENDKSKKHYADLIGIPLLEIPYTVKNNEDIIQLINDALNNTEQGLV